MSKIVDCIIGHSIGDAMGVPTEFCNRNELLKHPTTQMIGYGSHDVPAGTWSDDTSMEIAIIDSIINTNGIDYDDIMYNFYCWLHDSKYTAVNEVFDAGSTCIQSIINYSKGYKTLNCGQNAFDSNGNGSLMRTAPIALYSYYKNIGLNEMRLISDNVSSLTHAHEISKLGCYIYNSYIINLLKGLDKFEAYLSIKKESHGAYTNDTIKEYSRILENDISKLHIDDISSSGYVVDTLECALWIFLNSDNFKDCIIASTNIGNDTDTIGAVVGSLAGIYYGIESIPKEWIDKLQRKDFLLSLAAKFEQVCKKW